MIYPIVTHLPTNFKAFFQRRTIKDTLFSPEVLTEGEKCDILLAKADDCQFFRFLGGPLCIISDTMPSDIPIFVTDPSPVGRPRAFGVWRQADPRRIISIASRQDLRILGKCELKLPLLLIVGGEKRGISRSVIDSADILVKIDYAREFRASLSAASATTMFAYEIARQNF